MPLIHFLFDGCRFSCKGEGDNDIRIQLGPMENTTRHKIGLNLARGLGERCELPQRGSGRSPGNFSTFYVSGG